MQNFYFAYFTRFSLHVIGVFLLVGVNNKGFLLSEYAMLSAWYLFMYVHHNKHKVIKLIYDMMQYFVCYIIYLLKVDIVHPSFIRLWIGNRHYNWITQLHAIK